MLGFIAKIEERKLREAKDRTGEITAAKLYELLVEQWLDHEHRRVNPRGAPRGISREALRGAMTELARGSGSVRRGRSGSTSCRRA
jgi:hypothetical protein